MRITAKGNDGTFIYDVKKHDFRKLQLIYVTGIGGQLKQDTNSVLLRLPNTISKEQRNTLSKFLLQPEKLGELSSEDVETISRFVSQIETNLLTILNNLDLGDSKYLEIWNEFGSFIRNSINTNAKWNFE